VPALYTLTCCCDEQDAIAVRDTEKVWIDNRVWNSLFAGGQQRMPMPAASWCYRYWATTWSLNEEETRDCGAMLRTIYDSDCIGQQGHRTAKR